jgi:hypothetical protein
VLTHFNLQKQAVAAAKEKKSKEEQQEEREISRAMQKFLQLQAKGEHEPFIDGLVRTYPFTFSLFGQEQYAAVYERPQISCRWHVMRDAKH